MGSIVFVNAPNGLIYARSFYLDSMAENWSALVEGDYQYVMPLTWNKKFRIQVFISALFYKITGGFREKFSHSFEISSFLNAIPEMFRYWDIDLNENNFVSIEYKEIASNLSAGTIILSLVNDYEQLRQQYKRLAISNEEKSH